MHKTKNNSLPIGVFDSGVGGLSVLRALQLALPQESFLYLGDTARLPYGTKSPETVIRYALQASKTLVDRGVKLLVVACNTVSTLALPILQEYFSEIPVIGVLDPGAKAACMASQNGYIVVIATEATVNSGGYQNAIKKNRPDAQVIAESCSLFVALAEEGWVNHPAAELIAKSYLEPLFINNQGKTPDCLVLGCTHFPALFNAIKKVVGDQVVIVDSATATTELVIKTLDEMKLSASPTAFSPQTKFLVTDAPWRFARVAKQFLETELDVKDIELVELSLSTLAFDLELENLQKKFDF